MAVLPARSLRSSHGAEVSVGGDGSGADGGVSVVVVVGGGVVMSGGVVVTNGGVVISGGVVVPGSVVPVAIGGV